MFAAEGLMLVALFAGIAGIDLSRTHPFGAGALLLVSVYAMMRGIVDGFGWADGEVVAWMTAFLLPLAFWLLAMEVLSRSRSQRDTDLLLFGVQALWFAGAVVLLYFSGNTPGPYVATALAAAFGFPLLLAQWFVALLAFRQALKHAAETGEVRMPRPRARRWAIVSVILLATVAVALLARPVGTAPITATLLLAGIWLAVRAGEDSDEEDEVEMPMVAS